MIVRFQGGHNAGHTLVIDGKIFKLERCCPPVVVRGGKLSVIGPGVVVDPVALAFGDRRALRTQGVAVSGRMTLILADNAVPYPALAQGH